MWWDESLRGKSPVNMESILSQFRKQMISLKLIYFYKRHMRRKIEEGRNNSSQHTMCYVPGPPQHLGTCEYKQDLAYIFMCFVVQ